MTVIPDAATICGCGHRWPESDVTSLASTAPRARRRCPRCRGMGWYLRDWRPLSRDLAIRHLQTQGIQAASLPKIEIVFDERSRRPGDFGSLSWPPKNV